MRRWIALMLCFLPMLAFAGGESDPVRFSGIETIKFQNGVYPDPSYTGVLFYSMAQDSVLVTKGDLLGTSEHAYAADSTLKIGLPTASNTQRALFKVDLSAIPDSAVIVSAKVKFLKLDAGTGYTAITVTNEMGFWRIYWNWDRRVNWTNRTNNEAGDADTTWTTDGSVSAGAGDTAFRWEATGIGPGTYVHHSPWNNVYSTNPTDRGKLRNFGPDSLYSGGFQTSSNYGARVQDPDVIEPIRPFVGSGNAATDCWLEADITKLVRYWHTGTWLNQGCLISITGEATTRDVTFHSSKAYKHYTPLVTVEYVLASASGSSGGGGGAGRRLGGFGL